MVGVWWGCGEGCSGGVCMCVTFKLGIGHSREIFHPNTMRSYCTASEPIGKHSRNCLWSTICIILAVFLQFCSAPARTDFQPLPG